MEKYINCIVHSSSEGNLLIGENKTVLFDCGMAFCADVTIQNVKNALNGRPLDYIFMTHTHYDHIGALPFFRKEWPLLQTATSETGAAVLLKDTPRRIIRELSAVAAERENVKLAEYSDDAFHADIIIKDGDIIPLGGFSVQVAETPGHTRDTIAFFIPELELLILNETFGVLLPDGYMYPSYLTSYNDAVTSIKKCRRMPYKYLSLPHRGVAGKEDTKIFFDKAMETANTCRDFILGAAEKNPSEEEMLQLFYQKFYNETLFRFQPKEAFMANARATITCTLREFPNSA